MSDRPATPPKKSPAQISPKDCEFKSKIVEEIITRLEQGRAVTYMCGRVVTAEDFHKRYRKRVIRPHG